MFDSERKCLGVLKCINKQGGSVFDKEDVGFATEVANNLAIMLEDDGGIKRVLALMRRQVQQKTATADTKADRRRVLMSLERGQGLPNNADYYGVGIDPYVTIQIVRGNPSGKEDMEKEALQERRLDRRNVERKFGKSRTVMQNVNPHWDETIAVSVPEELKDVPDEELFAHVMLWDYDSYKEDDLIGQAVFPLSTMPIGKTKATKPYHLTPIPGVNTYNLEPSRLWLSFTRRNGENEAK
eukprot:gnl/TRDRNA2_/TRDRNA2_136913_c0_seq2.p1 gnl/TRDRNA2_/TRDRNA2_136913_c0~~gnl/TRDRNA2_/TRDRNA2_136913_c0_seq2.p1  ORF type:complete len:260 (+),score=48.42 gnl/TRDRNA2_/TRDRNA2_136913_c0_seq2:61-780(+)